MTYVQLWRFNDVNTLSAYGLENSKACNKYQINFVTGLFKRTTQVAQFLIEFWNSLFIEFYFKA